MTSNNTKLTARERARAKALEARAEQQAREAAALADVEAFFQASEKLEEIEESYRKDAAALEERYADKRGPLELKAAQAVAGLHARGDTKPSIAAQLGITVPQVTTWIDKSGALAAAEATGPKPAEKSGAAKGGKAAAGAGTDEGGAGGPAARPDNSAEPGAGDSADAGAGVAEASELEQRASA